MFDIVWSTLLGLAVFFVGFLVLGGVIWLMGKCVDPFFSSLSEKLPNNILVAMRWIRTGIILLAILFLCYGVGSALLGKFF